MASLMVKKVIVLLEAFFFTLAGVSPERGLSDVQ